MAIPSHKRNCMLFLMLIAFSSLPIQSLYSIGILAHYLIGTLVLHPNLFNLKFQDACRCLHFGHIAYGFTNQALTNG